MNIQKDITIGEVVARNFRTAQIFERHGIDFCCGGKKTIEEACTSHNLNAEKLIYELSEVNGTSASSEYDFNSWELDYLIDHIVSTHHAYLNRALPNILAHAEKVASVHGTNHPETVKIAGIFSSLKDELEAHLMKEERMLFPYIKKLVEIKRFKQDAFYPPFGTIRNPISVMENEHEAAGIEFEEINRLSRNYSLPQDACTTYQVLYKELKEFEEDLHIHVHLENNILFPKAIELENVLTSSVKI
jgi:regulator of cell morphogenesis and NO signaling